MNRKTIALTGVPMLSTLGATIAQAQTPLLNTGYPQVLVNQQPVEFVGQPPIEQNGRLLIPLRGVLEKMGAFVSYDGQSKTVTAYRGATRITLPMGSRQALVNDRSVALDVPAQVVNGSTLVPLRFVAESLGAEVRYDYTNRAVSINSAPSTNGAAGTVANNPNNGTGSATTAIQPPIVTNTTTISGEVVSVFPNVSPRRVVVRVTDPSSNTPQDRTFPLRENATVSVRRQNGSVVDVTLNRVQVGDRVEVRQAANGAATSLQVLRRDLPARGNTKTPVTQTTFKGEFLETSKDGNRTILKMTDGRLIEVDNDVPIAYDGQKIGMDDLRSGDQMTIAVDPKTKRGTRIIIAPDK